ncbi:hypothetical protein LCIT_17200 [Leuconostoc citreum]|uniref:Uncharacterized protein n=1 Tax=Leuconostoc citreum TaxID=33964 RepID=A0A5A5U1Z8_LEUCI|nr:hypothetical protein [Leuconostoc citreum]GDZ84478.1 hypothetical protein LCIT_17200 [Leuconostoc citreum]
MRIIDENLSLIKDKKDIDYYFRHDSKLKSVFLELQRIDTHYYDLSGNLIIYVNGKYAEKNRIWLKKLLLTECITRVSSSEISDYTKKRMINNYRYGIDYNIYTINRIDPVKFERLKLIKGEAINNYPVICLLLGKNLGAKVFKHFISTKCVERYYTKESLEVMSNLVWLKGSVPINILAKFFIEHNNYHSSPSVEFEWSYEKEKAYIISTIKALDNIGYWRNYDLEIRYCRDIQPKMVDINPNQLLITNMKQKSRAKKIDLL